MTAQDYELTEQQRHLLASIPPAIGADAREKDWAPVMSEAVWGALGQLPAGLVERHEKWCPIMPYGPGMVLGRGFCRLTEDGAALVAQIAPTSTPSA